MKRALVAFVAAVLLTAAAWTAQGAGQVYTTAGEWAGCEPSSVTVVAVADGETGSGGTFTGPEMRTSTGSTIRRSFVMFNLPAIPDGCELTSATFSLVRSGGTATGRNIEVSRVLTAWSEASPPSVNVSVSTAGQVTLTACAPGPCVMAYDVTEIVEAQYAGSNHGLRIRDNAESSGTATRTFGTRENSNAALRPQLSVSYG